MSDKGTKGLKALILPNGPYAGEKKERESPNAGASFHCRGAFLEQPKGAGCNLLFTIRSQTAEGHAHGTTDAFPSKGFILLSLRMYVMFSWSKWDWSKTLQPKSDQSQSCCMLYPSNPSYSANIYMTKQSLTVITVGSHNYLILAFIVWPLQQPIWILYLNSTKK